MGNLLLTATLRLQVNGDWTSRTLSRTMKHPRISLESETNCLDGQKFVIGIYMETKNLSIMEVENVFLPKIGLLFI